MSVNAIQSQGTKIYIASGTSGAKTITGIVAGNPTIITSAAHGLSNGDVVAFAGVTGADAALLNALSFVVTNKTTNTFAVQLDSTGKTLTGTGTATPTAFTQIKEFKGFNPSGASADTLECTDLDSVAKEFKTGLPDSGTISIEYNALDSDAGQAALAAAFTGALTKTFKVVYPAGITPNRTFTASVTKFSTTPDAPVNGLLTGTAELKISGEVTVS